MRLFSGREEAPQPTIWKLHGMRVRLGWKPPNWKSVIKVPSSRIFLSGWFTLFVCFLDCTYPMHVCALPLCHFHSGLQQRRLQSEGKLSDSWYQKMMKTWMMLSFFGSMSQRVKSSSIAGGTTITIDTHPTSSPNQKFWPTGMKFALCHCSMQVAEAVSYFSPVSTGSFLLRK